MWYRRRCSRLVLHASDVFVSQCSPSVLQDAPKVLCINNPTFPRRLHGSIMFVKLSFTRWAKITIVEALFLRTFGPRASRGRLQAESPNPVAKFKNSNDPDSRFHLYAFLLHFLDGLNIASLMKKSPSRAWSILCGYHMKCEWRAGQTQPSTRRPKKL